MEIDLKKTYLKISRRLEAILRSQAPVDTGRLRNSIAVVYNEKGLTIMESSGYGIFTHQGTGKYRKGNTYADTMKYPFNLNPGIGQGGIKPRYWLNFKESVWADIEQEIAVAIGLILQTEIANAFKK